MSAQIKARDYFPVVEDFLRHLNEREDIRCVCLVALSGREEPAHCISTWHCNPFDMMEVAGTLQLLATERYITPDDDETEEEDNDDEQSDD